MTQGDTIFYKPPREIVIFTKGFLLRNVSRHVTPSPDPSLGTILTIESTDTDGNCHVAEVSPYYFSPAEQAK